MHEQTIQPKITPIQAVKQIVEDACRRFPEYKKRAIRSGIINLRHRALTSFGVPRSNDVGQRLGLRRREEINTKLMEAN